MTAEQDPHPARPWPAPRWPWVMAQVWHDLLFAHWRVDPAALREWIPKKLEVETFDGSAWLGIVPFRMTGVRPRLVPPLPGLSAFPELNVRTYVTDGRKPGVWFFSLDAGNPIAVEAARALFCLPYYRARMDVGADGPAVRYSSVRTDRRGGAAELRATYEPTGVAHAPRGSLEYWLTYRYCLYAAHPNGRVYRAEIDHPPWPLQTAKADFAVNSMTAPIKVEITGTPLLHFSRIQKVVVWPPVPI